MDVNDVSDLFRRGFQIMHKSSNLGQSIQDRKAILSDFRREKRSTLAFQNRNIDVNMSPINTPKVERHVEKDKGDKNKVPLKNKRLEMLAEWKKQKAQQKEMEKMKNTRPVFKVSHIKSSFKSDIDTANKFIKGKPIPFNVAHSWGIKPDHQFKFKAPNFNQNILPIKDRHEKSRSQVEIPKVTSSIQKQVTVSLTRVSNKSNPIKTGKVPELNIPSKSKDPEIVQSKYSLRKRNVVGTTKRVDSKSDSRTRIKTTKVSSLSRNIGALRLANENVSSKSAAKTLPNELVVNILSEKLNTAKESEGADNNSDDEVIIKSESAKKISTGSRSNEVKDQEVIKPTKKTPVHKKAGRKTSSVGVKFTPKKLNTSDHERKENEENITPSNTKVKLQKNMTSTEKIVSNKPDGSRLSARRSIKGALKELNTSEEVVEKIDTDKLDTKSPKRGYNKDNDTPKSTKKSTSSKTVGIRRSAKRSSKGVPEKLTDHELAIESEYVMSAPPLQTDESDMIERFQLKSLSVIVENITPVTPVKNSVKPNENETNEEPFYISPHVTFARGKDAARKEYKMRLSSGGSLPETQQFSKSIIQATTPKAGAKYFTYKLDEEVARIERLCREWEDYRADPALPSEAHDSIDVAIGQSKLLMTKKFAQFRGLIAKCRAQGNDDENDRPVTCQDLHGFWDMLYMQVEDVDKRFLNLCRLKENNWKDLLPEKTVVAAKKRGRGVAKKTTLTASSKLKEAIKAAREKKKQADNELENVIPIQEEKVFEGGYFEVRSPVCNVVQTPNKSEYGTRSNLRRSALMVETKRRCSSSPGLTIMSVSSSIKLGNGLTPSKSILKSAGSTVKSTKSVIFSDEKNIVKIRLFEDDL